MELLQQLLQALGRLELLQQLLQVLGSDAPQEVPPGSACALRPTLNALVTTGT